MSSHVSILLRILNKMLKKCSFMTTSLKITAGKKFLIPLVSHSIMQNFNVVSQTVLKTTKRTSQKKSVGYGTNIKTINILI